MSSEKTTHQFSVPIRIGDAFVTAASRRGDDITVQVVGGPRSGQLDLGVVFDAHREFTPAILRQVREAVGSDHGKR